MTTKTATKISAKTKTLVAAGLILVLGLAVYNFVIFYSSYISVTVAPIKGLFTMNVANYFQNNPDSTLDIVSGAANIYWLDTDGNICHGKPGVSGQPGAVQKLGSTWVEARGLKGSVISGDKLAKLQNFNIDFFDSAITGTYIVQFLSPLYRDRAGGEVILAASPSFSMPMDMSVSNELTTSPSSFKPSALLSGHPCFTKDRNSLPVPSPDLPLLDGGESQHATKCRAKSALTAGDLMKACVNGRLSGGFIDGYLRIK